MNYIKDTIEYLSKLFQWWILIQPWERGVRTRFGKRIKLLEPGTHLRIPFFDIIYVQTVRLRVVSMCPQTISTKDGKTITVSCAIGYSISDIMLLFNTLYHPEVTISNLVQGYVADYVFSHNLNACEPEMVESYVASKLAESSYGIKYEYTKILTYAVVRTYRLIQDGHWTDNKLDMNDKR